MITLEDALELINGEPVIAIAESSDLDNSPGRIIAEDVISDIDMPPFNKSAMDGFACRRSDLGGVLEIIETVGAGDLPQKTVGRGECARIMTGARVPDGADCVIMVEHTEISGNGRVRFTGPATANNIAYQAEDMKKGDVAIQKGCLIRPQHVAILASTGCTHPPVFKRPRVAVLTTGNEISEPGEVISGTNIRNSNGPQLIAQIKQTGGAPAYLGIVKDTPEEILAAIEPALASYDIVIITGGVSMGDFDYVPLALKEAGVRLFFEKVAVQPGRPTVFGRKDDVFVFGLPGNPVSSFIIFEVMVKPLLFRLMGHKYLPPELNLPIAIDYSRKKADRYSFTPVSVNAEGMVTPESYHGSGHIHSLGGANGLMKMAPGIFSYKKGEIVNVRQI